MRRLHCLKPAAIPCSHRKEIVVFKEGYRSRSYCLSECTQASTGLVACAAARLRAAVLQCILLLSWLAAGTWALPLGIQGRQSLSLS